MPDDNTLLPNFSQFDRLDEVTLLPSVSPKPIIIAENPLPQPPKRRKQLYLLQWLADVEHSARVSRLHFGWPLQRYPASELKALERMARLHREVWGDAGSEWFTIKYRDDPDKAMPKKSAEDVKQIFLKDAKKEETTGPVNQALTRFTRIVSKLPKTTTLRSIFNLNSVDDASFYLCAFLKEWAFKHMGRQHDRYFIEELKRMDTFIEKIQLDDQLFQPESLLFGNIVTANATNTVAMRQIFSEGHNILEAIEKSIQSDPSLVFSLMRDLRDNLHGFLCEIISALVSLITKTSLLREDFDIQAYNKTNSSFCQSQLGGYLAAFLAQAQQCLQFPKTFNQESLSRVTCVDCSQNKGLHPFFLTEETHDQASLWVSVIKFVLRNPTACCVTTNCNDSSQALLHSVNAGFSSLWQIGLPLYKKGWGLYGAASYFGINALFTQATLEFLNQANYFVGYFEYYREEIKPQCKRLMDEMDSSGIYIPEKVRLFTNIAVFTRKMEKAYSHLRQVKKDIVILGNILKSSFQEKDQLQPNERIDMETAAINSWCPYAITSSVMM
jgi:hypothetical protein